MLVLGLTKDNVGGYLINMGSASLKKRDRLALVVYCFCSFLSLLLCAAILLSDLLGGEDFKASVIRAAMLAALIALTFIILVSQLCYASGVLRSSGAEPGLSTSTAEQLLVDAGDLLSQMKSLREQVEQNLAGSRSQPYADVAESTPRRFSLPAVLPPVTPEGVRALHAGLLEFAIAQEDRKSSSRGGGETPVAGPSSQLLSSAVEAGDVGSHVTRF
ncbi:hypothetical protein NRI_0072 [Neorickettsia risticii str. Illinois]|uniref:Transmembrane protein n=1 Tax=Neorickettsia risticii (strain Illinois) TaxID=434131 RepID=C6V3V4_NEORI|nr:hypothetical protein NRI_0072 [Neorickettsia risticii str. Illinois]